MRNSMILELRQEKLALYRSVSGIELPDVDPARLADNFVYGRFLDELARVAPPDFGLKAGSRRHLQDLGFLSKLTMNCKDLREVFNIWLLYSDGAGELAQFSDASSRSGRTNAWTVLFEFPPFLTGPAKRMCAEELATSFFRFTKTITGEDLSGFEIEFEHAPSKGVNYRTNLRHEIRFQCPAMQVTGPGDVLDLPVVATQNNVLDEILQAFERENASPPGPVTRSVFDILSREHARPNRVSEVARAIGMSERTMMRKLALEGTGFGQVIDDYRRFAAQKLLVETALSTKQISFLVGFQTENSLRKAMKRWTVMSITEWSEQRSGKTSSLRQDPSG